jgi:hypothetical protein
MDIGTRIHEHSWRQGCFVNENLIQSAVPIGGTKSERRESGWRYIVVTQSCDLLSKKIDDEPWCEVLCLRSIPTADPSLQNGRNPRLMHLVVQESGIDHNFEVAAKDRLFIPRELLANHPPETTIEIDALNLELLTEWLAKRYTRPAFPDQFNVRLKPKREKFKNLLRKSHHLFRGFYLRLSSFEELPDNEAYRLKLLLVAFGERLHDQEQLVSQKAKELEYILRQCDKIEVVEAKVLSDDKTSLKLLDDYVPWIDYDYLSGPDVGTA